VGARDALDALVADAPTEGPVLLEAARLHIVTGDPVGADKHLDAASRLNLSPVLRGRLERERGRLLLGKRSYKAAGEALGKAMAAMPEDAEARLLFIDASLAREDKEAVSATLAEVVKKFAGKPEADLARGRVYVASGSLGPAVEALGKAEKALTAANAPPRRLADAKAWLGRALYFNNELGKAKTLLEEASKLDPGNVEAHFYLGLLLLDQRQPAAARAAFLAATAANPTFADAWFFYADTSRAAGDKAKAVPAFKKYLELAPRGDYAGEARRLSR
jgi:tetratricopeptide (TPR) repeat protein